MDGARIAEACRLGDISSGAVNVQGTRQLGELDEWTGEEAELHPRTAKATGAEYSVNRLYRGPHGETVTVHIAVITDYGEYGVHHFPPGCYRGSGYRLLSSERRQLEADIGDDVPASFSIPASFSMWGRNDGPVAVAYWYHFGDDVLFNIDECRRAQRERWGTRVWPSYVKVLLSTAADSPDQSPPHLEEFAKLVAGWTCAACNPTTGDLSPPPDSGHLTDSRDRSK